MTPVPHNENERLSDLQSYHILDTAPEPEYDDISKLAAYICNTPIALISLVDADRQWFKAKIGLETSETPRAVAFCAHTILEDRVLEVHDASQDPRFSANPLVLGAPGIRFYAGVPLVSRAGLALGSLCVIDLQPRRLEPAQVEALSALGRQAIQQMELRRTILMNREVQERIAHSEEQLSLAVSAGAIGFWDWNMRENTVTMSTLHEQLLGLEPTGKPRPVTQFFERLHPEDAPRISGEVNQAIATHGRYDTEMRVVWPDGTVHWMHDTGSAQYDQNGAPYRMNGTMADISERKRTERELELRQERFDLAVSASNTGVWDWSVATNLWYNTEISRKILGDTDDDPPWDTETWWERMHPDDRATLRPYVDAQLANPDVHNWRIETRLRHRDGGWRWLLVQARMARDSQGNISRVTGTHIDLTEQKERERVLAEAKAVADQANRAKSDFLANMSHEIRTPMHGIIGLARLLSDSSLNAEQRTYLHGIDSSAQSLLRLVNEVLDFSKVEAGKMTLETEPFDLARLLDEVRHQLNVSASSKGLLLQVQVDRSARLHLSGDVGRLRQVIINLAGNAIKFTERGFVRVHVWRVGGTDDHPQLRFEVSDSGIGIPSEAVGLLFQPFSQLDSSRSRRFAGTGLGLSICKRLVVLMGGEIGVESAPAQGSTFWVELALPVAEPITEPLTWGTAPAAQRSLVSNEQILVVEDNEINQMILVSFLQKMGLRTDVAVNGLEAVNRIRSNRYALVLMDCQMPTMDGYEASRMIRASHGNPMSQVPIIAMTANVMPGERERCLQSGMSDYITKPIDERILVATLQDWLKKGTHDTRGDGPTGVLNLAALDRLGGLRSADGRALIGKMIGKFRELSPQILQSMRHAILARDWVSLRREAHSLKSNAGYLGGTALEKACQELETLAGQHATRPQAPVDVEDLAGRVQELERLVSSFQDALGRTEQQN